MADRQTKNTKFSYKDLPVANGVAFEQGKMACIDTATGLITNGAVSTTLIPIGYFNESGTGDGTTTYTIRLFKEVVGHWWDNDDAGTPVVAADLGQNCFILDQTTVSGDGTGRSVAGRVWAVDTDDGVLVEMVGFAAG